MRDVMLRTLASCAAIGMALASAAQAKPASIQVAEQHQFAITSQGMASALEAFGRQSRKEVLFDGQQVASKRSAAIRGTYTPGEALKLLLAGSGLMFRQINADTYLVEIERPGEKVSRQDDTRVSVSDIVVTGTYIKGTSALPSPVRQVTRQELERAGYANTQQFLEHLPENFAGSVREGAGLLLGGSYANSTGAVAADLRGLGPDSTLVLLNGKRLAPTGLGEYVDVSAIPLSAVDRVEILSSGASAIYGADAVAGVMNFVLRKNYNGAESTARIGTSTRGDATEYQAGQLLGKSWSGGSLLLSYEYYQRDPVLTRDRFTGNFDHTADGGSDARLSNCAPGTIIAGDTSYAVPGGQSGIGLSQSSLTAGTGNVCSPVGNSTLLPSQRRHSGFARISQNAGDVVTFYASGLYSYRTSRTIALPESGILEIPESNYYRMRDGLFPGQGPITVNYNFANDVGGDPSSAKVSTLSMTVGATFNLPHTWTVDFSADYAREHDVVSQQGIIDLTDVLASSDPATAFNPFGDGTGNSAAVLNSLRQRYPAERSTGTVLTGQVLAEGPIFSLPGGSARMAVGSAIREETYDPGTSDFTLHRRDVVSAFGELMLPIIGNGHDLPGIRTLQVSLAGRYDDYSDFGHAMVGQAGIQWAPVSDLTLRGSYGHSFKAPTMRQLYAATQLVTTYLPSIYDAYATGPLDATVIRSGGNANLRPERSKSWTLGATYQPHWLPKAKLQFSYFDVSVKDRVASLTDLVSVFGLQDQLTGPGIFIRDPTQSQLDAMAAASSRINEFGPPLRVGQIDVVIDSRYINLSAVHVKGLDASASYSQDVGFGTIGFDLNASYLISNRQLLIPGTPVVERAGTEGYPSHIRLVGDVSLAHGPAFVQITGNFAGAGKDPYTTPGEIRTVAAWFTTDLNLTYDFGRSTALHIDGFQASLFVRNLLDTRPPFVNTIFGYDSANADPIGRTVSLSVRKRW